MNIKSIIIFIAVTIGVLAGVGGLLYQFGASTDKPITDIAGEGKHVSGEGVVELVEYSDFQCPACFSIQSPLKEILNKYEGKIKFVYRYFPLTSIHKNAQISAQAAEAAGMQGHFWQMHDKLFATQNAWSGIADPTEVFVGYAKELDLDLDKFKGDLVSQEIKDVINEDVLAATKYKINGTPTFFVNGIKTEFGQIEGKIATFVK